MGAILEKIEIIDFPKTMIIGKAIRMKENPGFDDDSIPSLWRRMNGDGTLKFLQNIDGCKTRKDCVGWMGDFMPGDQEYTYLAGILAEPGTNIPDGFETRTIESIQMAIAWIKETDTPEGGDIICNASEITSKALADSGYEHDFSKGFYEMEYYSFERLLQHEITGEKKILDYYTPCKKK